MCHTDMGQPPAPPQSTVWSLEDSSPSGRSITLGESIFKEWGLLQLISLNCQPPAWSRSRPLCCGSHAGRAQDPTGRHFAALIGGTRALQDGPCGQQVNLLRQVPPTVALCSGEHSGGALSQGGIIQPDSALRSTLLQSELPEGQRHSTSASWEDPLGDPEDSCGQASSSG